MNSRSGIDLEQRASAFNISHNNQMTAILAQGSIKADGKLAYRSREDRLHEGVFAASTPIRSAPLTQEKSRVIETQRRGLLSRHSNANKQNLTRKNSAP